MMTQLQDCIWCSSPVRKASIEHILPEALGCPPGFCLTDCVCMACNNRLGHVDQALLRQFEIIAFLGGVRRKGGRPPSIDNWAPIKARYAENGPELHMNAGPQTVDAFGARLPAASPRNGIQFVSLEPRIPGVRTELKFEQEFGRGPKFSRALHKVAFGALAYFVGAEEARSHRFDPVRDFVRNGRGQFNVMMTCAQQLGGHRFNPPVYLPERTLPIVEFEIFGVAFLLDLDVEQKGLMQVRDALIAHSASNWTILPRTVSK
ncbi:MAG: HNH endonuclease [Novosphingobium sp.]|nr:hypothetical protein [Novosphingobium sp.]